jgi:hypothetical protein
LGTLTYSFFSMQDEPEFEDELYTCVLDGSAMQRSARGGNWWVCPFAHEQEIPSSEDEPPEEEDEQASASPT